MKHVCGVSAFGLNDCVAHPGRGCRELGFYLADTVHNFISNTKQKSSPQINILTMILIKELKYLAIATSSIQAVSNSILDLVFKIRTR